MSGPGLSTDFIFKRRPMHGNPLAGIGLVLAGTRPSLVSFPACPSTPPLILAFIAFTLAACNPMPPPEAKIITHEVRILVPTPCKVDLPPSPTYPATPEALRAAKNIFERSQLVTAELINRRPYEAALLAALNACTGGG